jgi:carbon-monoxide dehydrogenase large subunit
MTVFGQRLERREDADLLKGQGDYVANLAIPDCLAACFVVSPYARATFRSVDTREALAVPGVVAVLTAADLDAAPLPSSLRDRPELARPPLARNEVFFVGEPYALVVAESAAAAWDAAELVVADFEPLEPVIDPEEAARDERRIRAESSNILRIGAVEPDPALFAGAEVRVRLRLTHQRLAPAPLETRAIAVIPGPRLEVFVSTQSPHRVKATLARCLALPADAIHVRARAVGGGFGAKAANYPEEVAVAAAARRLGRPIRWHEDRSRSMVGLVHGRAQLHDLELGATRDGRLVAYRMQVLQDCGAWPLYGPYLPELTTLMASGTYRIPRVEASYVSVATNTTPVAAYRGAGRPEAALAIERAMDLMASELGIDPVELRRRNLLAPEELPCVTPTGAHLDSGDYERALARACELAGYDRLRTEQRRRRERGAPLALGIGAASYVEVTNNGGSSEYGRIEVTEEGALVAYVGTSPHGQGHATAFAMLAADELGCEPDDITIVTGDTDLVPRGVGTFGSRSLQTGGVAVALAARELAARARARAASELEAAAWDIVLDGNGAHVQGSPSVALSWAELAARAQADGDPLEVAIDFTPEDATYPYGAHLAVVEVDTETGMVRLVRHIAVDDAGRILNPLLAEGQVHGGVAQGVAQALLEGFAYDEHGTPMTATLADYPAISATELPSITIAHQETPTTRNPLGVKGIGESGTIGATPAVLNAVIDALSHLGVRHLDPPATPERVRAAIVSARASE